MQATEREKKMYGANVEIVSRDSDCTIYKIADKTGEVLMTCYQVFPGIQLIYNDIHIEYCSIGKSKLGNVIEINHCREGRIECEFRNKFCYLSEGDMSIGRIDDSGNYSYFPLKHYRGISIMIDADRAPDCLSCILDDVDVKPGMLIPKFCNMQSCFIMREKSNVEHIFSELYSVPDSIRRGYFKVKILELLLFLSGMDFDENAINKSCVPKTQAVLAKSACKYMTKHMNKRITLAQLSDVFHVSGTQLKNSFKKVYGMSIYAYIRTQKMQSAALMLKQTDNTVLEIASHFGYDNGSKFASAFQDVMGLTPNDYRIHRT